MGYAMPNFSQGNTVGIEELVKNTIAVDGAQGASIPQAHPVTSQDERRTSSGPAPGLGPGTEGSSGLIRDTAGRKHFIGPSGSLQFLGQLRRLILTSRTDGGHGRHTPNRLTATFTDEDAAQALEADNNQGEQPGMSPALNGRGAGESPQSHASLGSSLLRDFASIPNGEIEEIRKQLPQRSAVDSLVRVYFRDIHPDFSLFHRGSFAEEYETYMSLAPTGTQSPSAGWLGCLHMAIAFASMSSANDLPPNVDFNSLSRHCVSLTRLLLPHLVAKCALTNVQALLLLALFLHNHNERNAAWNLVGTAKHMAFSLGLHRDTDNQAHFRPMEREARKRVFCTLYGFEQFLASSLGRPTGLYEFEDVEIVPAHEALLDGGEDDDDTTTLSLELQGILAQARVSLAVKSMPMTGDQANRDSLACHEHASREILGALNQWKNRLASRHALDMPFIGDADDILCEGAQESPRMSLQELRTMMGWQSRRRLRTALVLQLQYRYIGLLVTRSALLLYVATAPARSASERAELPDAQSSDTPGEHLSDLCITHAVQLCRLILLADSVGLVNGTSAMDVFYAYCGVMVLILRSLHVGISASPHHDQHEARLQMEQRRLIAETREVLLRVKKCSTMTRFARVVAAFEEGSRPDRSHRLAPIDNHAAVNGQPAMEAVNALPSDPFHSVEQLSNPAAEQAAVIDPTIDSIRASQQGPGTGTIAGLLDTTDPSWQSSSLTTFDGPSEANSWMVDSFLGLDGTGAVDWNDIETLLARNIGQ